METTANSTTGAVPIEILEKIFSYCSHKDLVQCIQNVCSQWRLVAQSTHLWKHRAYCPEIIASSKEIVWMLKISPKLEKLILKHECDNNVLQAVTDNCPELRKLQLSPEQKVELNFVKNLQEKCPKLEYLNIEDEVLADKLMCEIVGKFTNLKVLILYESRDRECSLNLKLIADHCTELEHFEFCSDRFEINNLRYFLCKRRERLHTLGLSCNTEFDECVLPLMSICKKLTSLTLFAYEACFEHWVKMEHLGRLKTVRKLTIHGWYSGLSYIKGIFENENLAQLRELSFYEVYVDITDIIVRNCPLLQILTLDHCPLSDDSLKMLHNLKQLNSLTLTSIRSLTDNRTFYLQDLQHLNCLRIAWCSSLTNLGLKSIAKLSTLRNLVLWEQDLAEFPWDLIPCNMKFLTCLDICFCHNVDTYAIENLKSSLPSLKVILDEDTESEHCTIDDAMIRSFKIFRDDI